MYIKCSLTDNIYHLIKHQGNINHIFFIYIAKTVGPVLIGRGELYRGGIIVKIHPKIYPYKLYIFHLISKTVGPVLIGREELYRGGIIG